MRVHTISCVGIHNVTSFAERRFFNPQEIEQKMYSKYPELKVAGAIDGTVSTFDAVAETKPDASLTEDQSVSTSDEMPGDKIEDILPYEEKDLDEPVASSIEEAKSKQVVEFSDYKELEDEYNRVKQEISRRNSLLEDMISSYRENKMIDTSDRTAQRIREESDNKRIMIMRSKIKELERKQKRQLNFLRVAMSNMQEKFEIYKSALF